MKLLERMRAELSHLWKEAMCVEAPEARQKLLEKYYQARNRYKKQTQFFEAMKDRTPVKSMISEDQI
jgi:hypothetical protein